MSLVQIIFKASVKQVLVEMTINDELPMDMNDLDIATVFEKAQVITENDDNYKNAVAFDKAIDYLVDESQDGGLDVIDQVNTIRQHLVEHPTIMIDHLDGVQVVEEFEYDFTVQDFLKEIGLID